MEEPYMIWQIVLHPLFPFHLMLNRMNAGATICPPQRAASCSIFKNRCIFRQTLVQKIDSVVDKPGNRGTVSIDAFPRPETLKPAVIGQHAVPPQHPVIVKWKFCKYRVDVLSIDVRCLEPAHVLLLVYLLIS